MVSFHAIARECESQKGDYYLPGKGVRKHKELTANGTRDVVRITDVF